MIEEKKEQNKTNYSQPAETDVKVQDGVTTTFSSKDAEKASYEVVDGYEVAKVETTDQVKSKAPNPTGKGGFGDNPQNRNPGGWKKEDTARYKLEQIIKMNDEEIQDYQNNESTPTFEKRMAKAVEEGRWKDIEGMINQIYGKPQESVDVTTQGESVNPYASLTVEELRKLAGK